jgi:hypothetical protein
VATLAEEYQKLEQNIQLLRPLAGIGTALAVLETKLDELKEQLRCARGLFTACEPYISDPALLAHIGSHHRAVEAALIRGEFKERSWGLEMSEAPLAKQLLLQDQRESLLSTYGVREVRYLESLTMAIAAGGFTRQAVEPTGGWSPAPLRFNAFSDGLSGTRDETPIYAQPVRTEGIWFRFDPCWFLRWAAQNLGWNPPESALADPRLAHAFIIQAAPALAGSPAYIRQLTTNGSDNPQTRDAAHLSGLLHTISHSLLRTAQRGSGYNSLTLTEYIFPFDLSVLVSVVPRKTFITRGLRTAYEHGLPSWLEEAAVQSLTCAFDPVCSHRGSSCNACAQLPLGCETHNHGVSRGYLHGGVVPKVIEQALRISRGFWV